MADRKLNRDSAKAALETIRESPFISAVVIVPAVLIFIVAWALGGFGWAIFALIVLGGLGYVLFKRS